MNEIDALFGLYWCIGCLAVLLIIAVCIILFLVFSNYFETHKDKKDAIEELSNKLFAYYNKSYLAAFYTDFYKYRVKRYCRKIAKIIICKSYMKGDF